MTASSSPRSDAALAAESSLPALIQNCLRGDQQAIVELVTRFQGQVFGLCYRMLGQRQDAEDVVQETFIRVIHSLHRFDPQREFEPWLLTIAGNRCRTFLARRQRRPAPHPLVDQLADGNAEAQRAGQLEEEVQLGLQQMRAEYRRAFLLFHRQQLSYAEIAERLDCPLGTAKTWVHRARRQLVEFLSAREVLEETGHVA